MALQGVSRKLCARLGCALFLRSVLRLAVLTARGAAALPRQWVWRKREFLPLLGTGLTFHCKQSPFSSPLPVWDLALLTDVLDCNLCQNAPNFRTWGAVENNLTKHTLCCNKTPTTRFPTH